MFSVSSWRWPFTLSSTPATSTHRACSSAGRSTTSPCRSELILCYGQSNNCLQILNTMIVTCIPPVIYQNMCSFLLILWMSYYHLDVFKEPFKYHIYTICIFPVYLKKKKSVKYSSSIGFKGVDYGQMEVYKYYYPLVVRNYPF